MTKKAKRKERVPVRSPYEFVSVGLAVAEGRLPLGAWLAYLSQGR